jgi:hypothetical protein
VLIGAVGVVEESTIVRLISNGLADDCEKMRKQTNEGPGWRLSKYLYTLESGEAIFFKSPSLL